MKKFLTFLMAGALILVFSCTGGQRQSENDTAEVAGPNQLTQQEQEEGWKLLFNGENTEGWRGVNKDTLPSAWEVSEEMLKFNGSGRGEAGSRDGGDILYDEQFSDFHLKIDWRISEGGNSGILYLGQEVEGTPIWQNAPEFQVLDNERHPDAQLGENGNRMAGSLYDIIPADPQTTKPAGEWNSAEILVYRGTVVHKLNGETVVEYHLWTDDWNEKIANSKFPRYNANWADVARSGYIALQDHGDDVWYRNIKIKEL